MAGDGTLEQWEPGTCESSEARDPTFTSVCVLAFFKPVAAGLRVQTLCLLGIRFIACMCAQVYLSPKPPPPPPGRWAEVIDDGWRL